jgi:hypothetical protein
MGASFPVQQTLLEIQSWTYTDCSTAFTDFGTVSVGGDEFYAEPVTYSFYGPSTDFVVTATYVDVMLGSLDPNEPITFVYSCLTNLAEMQSHIFIVTTPGTTGIFTVVWG